MSENKVKTYDESYMDELKITTADDLYKNENEGYVFISYCSKNKETVFRDVVIPMQKEYGLRVYADKAFDYKNDEWVNQMQENLAASQAVLIFVSNEYVCSYACFLEVLTAVQEDIPILPIYIDENPIAGDSEKVLSISNNTRGAFEDIANQLNIKLLLENKIGTPSKELLNVMAGYLKLKNPIQNNKLKEKLLSQKFTGMLKELAPIKHSINKSRDALISCINDTIKSKNCPVFSELPVKESKTKESKAVKATDTVNVKTAVTKKPIQEKEEASTDVKTDIIEKAESADAVKKGIEIYSVCGKEFTGNQSKMMIDVMKYIIENHFDMLDILEQKLTSVSKKAISELKKAGVNYFNTGSEFTYQGQIYSVGTSYDRSAKMSQIRNAIMLTGENPSDFIVDGLFNEQQLEKAMLCYNNVNNSDSSEEVAAIARKQGDEVYKIGNQEFTGNQSKMMTDVMKYIIEKHFDMFDLLAQNLTSVGDGSIDELKKDFTYFNTGRQFSYNGKIYSVGTAYDRSTKMRQIRNAIMLTGENPSDFVVDGLFNEQQLEKAMLCYNNVNSSDSSEEVSAIARKQGDEVYKIGNQEFTGNQSKIMTDAMKKQFEMAILRNNNANNPDSSKEVAAIARKQGDEVYRIGNQEFTGNQSKMMTDAMKYIIEKHFDMLDILEQKLTSVSKKPISELKKAGVNYFNSGSEFTYQGQIYSVGTSYGRNEKLAQIRNAIMLTGEEPQKFDINGLFNEKQFEEAEMRYYELFSEMAEE